jgi:hypothetical protein
MGQFQLEGFSFRRCFVIVAVLACKPGLKPLVLAIEHFQGLGDDVRRGAVEELSVFRELQSWSSSLSWTTVVLGCLGGAFNTAIEIFSFLIRDGYFIAFGFDYIRVCTRAKHDLVPP